MTSQTPVQRAAEHIDAIQLADGTYAHLAAETSTYWVFTADQLAELCDYLDHDDADIRRDAYSHWCAGTGGREMPRGWTPEQQGSTYTWRTDAAHGEIWAASLDAAVAAVVADDEWSEIDSDREVREIADGAYLLVRDSQTGAEYRRGETP